MLADVDVEVAMRLAAVIVIGFWAVLQFFDGVAEITSRTAQTADTGGVAYWAHVGGFVAGLIVGFISVQMISNSNPRWNNYRANS